MELGTVYNEDCLETMCRMPDNFVDTIVTDPPYALEFMNKHWDRELLSIGCCKEMLRVSKPGAILMSFGGTRTWHRLTCVIEDAGWIIRDTVMWLYGSGFPKSLDISKATDKAKGVKREDKFEGSFERFAGPTGNKRCENCDKWLISSNPCQCPRPQDEPVTEVAKLWNGWGTALKPAWEPILVCMKPLDGTFAENAERWGVAGLNIDGARIPISPRVDATQLRTMNRSRRIDEPTEQKWGLSKKGDDIPEVVRPEGRWPANVILDEEAARMLDEQTGIATSGMMQAGTPRQNSDNPGKTVYGKIEPDETREDTYGDSGGASRFFYVAKASRSEREEGLHSIEAKKRDESRKQGKPGGNNPRNRGVHEVKNFHPTVKPVELMRYLVKLTKTPTDRYELLRDCAGED